MMKTYQIAVLPGDGVGPEVTAEGVKVLREVPKITPEFELEITHFEAGAEVYKKTGVAFPREVFDFCKNADAIFLGAMGLPTVTLPNDTDAGGEVVLRLRFDLDLFISLRPGKLYPGISCPIAGKKPGDIDYMVFRELTEGLYASHGGGCSVRDELAVDNLVITRKGTERLLHEAFQYARRTGAAPKDKKKRVTCVDKSNVLRTSAYFRSLYNEIAASYPDVERDYAYVDAATIYLIQNPQHYHVLVMENMFGDIITDLAAATVGGLGVSPSADVGKDHGLFQPVHGSAPTLAGKGIVNPLATILSAGLMLQWLGDRHSESNLTKGALLIEKAVENTLTQTSVRTVDLGGKSSTQEVGSEVVRQLKNLKGI